MIRVSVQVRSGSTKAKERVSVKKAIRNDGGKSCPPHTPLIAQPIKEGTCVVSCLKCGATGPERKNSQKAKLAFDEVFCQLF